MNQEKKIGNKAIVASGPFGAGKTSLLASTASELAKDPNKVITFIVAESSPIVPDTVRYGKNSFGVSFSSVCCPTLEEILYALQKGISMPNSSDEKKTHEKKTHYYLIEPPGNLPVSVVIQALQSDELLPYNINLEHVIAVVSQKNYHLDKYKIAFRENIRFANIVVITHLNESDKKGYDEIIKTIKDINPNCIIVPLNKGEIFNLPTNRWSVERVFPYSYFIYVDSFDNPFRRLNSTKKPGNHHGHSDHHGDHYSNRVYVIDPDLGMEKLEKILIEISGYEHLVRAKGVLPNNTFFDIVSGEINYHPLNNYEGLYYVFVVVEEGKPFPSSLEELNKIKKQPIFNKDTPLEEMISAFGYLYNLILTNSQEVNRQETNGQTTIYGKVSHTFQPVDEAYKIALEIYAKSGNISSLALILPKWAEIRINALKELRNTNQEDKNYVGLQLASNLIQKLTNDKGRPFSDLLAVDIRREIIREVIPDFFNYIINVSLEELNVPRYSEEIAPFFVRMAYVAIDNLPLYRDAIKAAEHMIEIHQDMPQVKKGWVSFLNYVTKKREDMNENMFCR